MMFIGRRVSVSQNWSTTRNTYVLTFSFRPDSNFLTGCTSRNHIMGRHFYGILVSALQTGNRESITVWQKLGLCPGIAQSVVRNSIPLQRGTPILGRIPTDAYAVCGRILHDDLWCNGWLHGNHLILYFITTEKIVCRAGIISGQAVFDAFPKKKRNTLPNRTGVRTVTLLLFGITYDVFSGCLRW